MEGIKSDQMFAQTVKAALSTVSLSPRWRKRIEEKIG
jgi:hypothetical protein